MLSRERLWQRVCGARFWVMAWALAAASLVPWFIPERWNGQISALWIIGGWGCVLGSLLLVRFPRWRLVPLAAVLVWATFLGLRRQAAWETQLPLGYQVIQGRIVEPWRLLGERRLSTLQVEAPASLKGCLLPLGLPAEGSPGPDPGTPVRFRGELRAVEAGPVFIAERPLWRARGDGAPRRIFLRSAQLMEVLGSPEPAPLVRLRSLLLGRFDRLPLPPSSTARDIWGALTLGIAPARDEAFSVFAESGTIHTLVVSGLQVTLVMALVEALWRRFLRRGGGLASVLAGLLYAAVVGFSAPVWRGWLMGAAWGLGRSRGWRLPPVLTLHGALGFWLITHPAAGCEPGFLLAWWALLGLLWGAEPLAGLLSPALGRWALPVARVVAPWLSTIPLLALFHGGVPVWGVVANALILPLVAVLTPVCLGLTLVPIPGAVEGVGWVLGWLGDSLLPGFARIAPVATGILWPWLLLALGWIWLAQRHALLERTRALALTLVAATVGLVGMRGTGRSPGHLSLEAVDVGQGDALLLRVPGGHATVVDTGPSPWAARRLVRVLSRRGVREPVDLVITHPHRDHAGGWTTFQRLWPVDTTRIPGLAEPTEVWAGFEPLVGRARPVLRGEAWPLGAAVCRVQWPPKPFLVKDANAVSLVLQVRWQDRELWLMGDALGIQERDLMDLGDPEPGRWRRLLKPGHHGSRSACDPDWLAALRPEGALLTAGRNNPFGFPHAEVMTRLQASGCTWAEAVGPACGIRIEATPSGWRIQRGDGTASP